MGGTFRCLFDFLPRFDFFWLFFWRFDDFRLFDFPFFDFCGSSVKDSSEQSVFNELTDWLPSADWCFTDDDGGDRSKASDDFVDRLVSGVDSGLAEFGCATNSISRRFRSRSRTYDKLNLNWPFCSTLSVSCTLNDVFARRWSLGGGCKLIFSTGALVRGSFNRSVGTNWLFVGKFFWKQYKFEVNLRKYWHFNHFIF